jgi:hypothetical protein
MLAFGAKKTLTSQRFTVRCIARREAINRCSFKHEAIPSEQAWPKILTAHPYDLIWKSGSDDHLHAKSHASKYNTQKIAIHDLHMLAVYLQPYRPPQER